MGYPFKETKPIQQIYKSKTKVYKVNLEKVLTSYILFSAFARDAVLAENNLLDTMKSNVKKIRACFLVIYLKIILLFQIHFISVLSCLFIPV
jgi:hypothetical protein